MAVDRIGDDRAAPLGAATMWRTAGHRLFASRCKARLRAAEKAGALSLQRNDRGLGRSSIRHAPSRTWWPRQCWKPQDCGKGGSTLAQAVAAATGLLAYLEASAIQCGRRPRMQDRPDNGCTAWRQRWLEMLITAATATTRMTGPLRLHLRTGGRSSLPSRCRRRKIRHLPFWTDRTNGVVGHHCTVRQDGAFVRAFFGHSGEVTRPVFREDQSLMGRACSHPPSESMPAASGSLFVKFSPWLEIVEVSDGALRMGRRLEYCPLVIGEH